MKKTLLVGATLFVGVSISLTLGTDRVTAQGPAGAGASSVVQNGSHSLNPINWLRKDSKNSTDVGNRSEAESKLTPRLQTRGMLATNTTVTDMCAPFTTLEGCLEAFHASHNLGVNFFCLRAAVTGVHTSADVSGCTIADEGKSESLERAIHQLKPNAKAKQAAKEAEQQATEDLKGIGA
jgi:hypothetical protein